MDKRITFEPIGYVTTDADDQTLRDKKAVSKITINKSLKKSLEGINGFSHLFVIYHLSKILSEEQKILKVHPRGRMELPLIGVFATRTMLRPNPIGLTLVELLEVKGNVLIVKGLDAINGTPVLDIKPYDPWDSTENPRMPEWWTKLEHEKSALK